MQLCMSNTPVGGWHSLKLESLFPHHSNPAGPCQHRALLMLCTGTAAHNSTLGEETTLVLYTAPEPMALLLTEVLRRARCLGKQWWYGKEHMALLSQHWRWLFITSTFKEGRNICLGKEEEMRGTTLVLRTAQARGKTLVKSLWISSELLGRIIWQCWKNSEGHSWQAHSRLTMHLCFFVILWNTLTSHAGSPALSCLMMGQLHS